MHYDVAIIGAGMSGLAAGIRLAYFGHNVCIFEKHYAYGGLNSYYTLHGRQFDVGLHAVTNFVPPDVRSAPLPKLLRQLRLTREDLELSPQRHSLITFGGRTLRFTNEPELFIEQVQHEFPKEADGFVKLVKMVDEYNDWALDQTYRPTREVLKEYIRDPQLIEALLCPIMFYGCADQHEMDFTQFVTMFKALFREGFARPLDGVRTIIKALVKKFRSCGGKIQMRCGVQHIVTDGKRATALTLETGETITADKILSCAGYPETMNLCQPPRPKPSQEELGQMSFVEAIAVLDGFPADMGHDATIVFYNDASPFTFAKPTDLVDTRSGVVCCPSNYQAHNLKEGLFRVTWQANYDRWCELDEQAYSDEKQALRSEVSRIGARYIPDFANRIVDMDMFTPRTIRKYTGHLNGAVYGSPKKHRDGRTPLENLFICGTDQGFLGIIGAMMSGVTIANLHVLSA